jgi:hypothetical protein
VTPTKQVELRVQIEHSARVQRRLSQPGEETAGIVLGGLLVGGSVAIALFIWCVTRAM